MPFRGRVKELPPPHARFQQELSEVAGALRSGRGPKKWQELNQVGREKYFSLTKNTQTEK